MKKMTTMMVSTASLLLALSATNGANAEDLSAQNHSQGHQVSDNRLFQLEIEKALHQRAEQRRHAQKKAPAATFVGFKEVAR